MILSSIEKIAGDIGFDIAHSNDQVQADLINGLSRGLCNSMQPYDFDMQLCYITDKLNANSRRLIEGLYEFIKLKEGKK